MQSMLAAETAVFVHLETVGIILLVLLRLVVSLLALTARQCDLNSHNGTSCLIYKFAAYAARTSLKRVFFCTKKKPLAEVELL